MFSSVRLSDAVPTSDLFQISFLSNRFRFLRNEELETTTLPFQYVFFKNALSSRI
ncbi:hypothetical protein LEP1GSC021_1504 [Leptospira noguchii str. 1993005606]|nr:hypothetical protein LEP1GSC021_1504 [Leptospira noguchii str. 1993005606]